MQSIRFGTDGWRGIIAEDFTFAHARIVAHAIARYVVRGEDARKGVLVGYDHRFASDTIAAAVAETISATGTPVWLTDKPCPTPTISLLVRQHNAAGGIVITASHNPYGWNGIKYKASYGSSALPSIVAQIESELAKVLTEGAPSLPPRNKRERTISVLTAAWSTRREISALGCTKVQGRRSMLPTFTRPLQP